MAISCRQNTNPLLISPPKEDDETTDEDNTGNDNSDGDNTGGGNTNDSWYGYYNVSILMNNTIITKKYRISDTYNMFIDYYNMIIDSATGEAQFKLHKVNTSSTAEGDTYYTFNTTNLNIMKIEVSKEGNENTDGSETVKKTIAKKFRGVCLVRIYPDAVKVANSSLLGDYTLAGVYTEIENTSQVNIEL